LKKHAKQLKEEIIPSLEVTLDDNIENWIDIETMTPIISMAVQQSEENIIKNTSSYSKAKKLGEKFAREITD